MSSPASPPPVTDRDAERALACLDLTSLNLDDTPARIDELCDKALAPGPGITLHPAAVCVYPRFAGQCRQRLAGSEIEVAVVVNFPGGDASVADVVAETERALRDGATEIDVVLPYRDYLAGRRAAAVDLVRTISHTCRERDEPALMKVILETGVLADPEVITAAGLDAVEAGAMFLKTSTGKLEPGATPEAVSALLEVATSVHELQGRAIGVKVSGGVRTVADAAFYLALADEAFAPDEAGPANFRFGASGLLTDIVRMLTGSLTSGPAADPSGY